jgi:hypothetical protein
MSAAQLRGVRPAHETTGAERLVATRPEPPVFGGPNLQERGGFRHMSGPLLKWNAPGRRLPPGRSDGRLSAADSSSEPE